LQNSLFTYATTLRDRLAKNVFRAIGFGLSRRHFVRLVALVILLIGTQNCGLENFTPGRSPSQYRELAIIFNQADPLSVQIAQYYQRQRGIPVENLIAVEFAPNRPTLSPAEFQRLKADVDAKTPANVQSYALTWAAPYRVGCMSITSAFTFGFDQRYCANGCVLTKANPYFNSNSTHPYTDFRMRPTMAIAAREFGQAKALIDRGIASDNTAPKGTAYFLSTSDSARNVRAAVYARIFEYFGRQFEIRILRMDTLENRPDVMFYFTGLSQVEKLQTNHFLPGAIADHLTSWGGALTDSAQMSSLRWLEAGATGSYGTVEEPCNFLQKFPHPGIVMAHYLHGDTLLQAYWKSVEEPGQGIFIGEPLAHPFAQTLTH